jgi:hypothetical protein
VENIGQPAVLDYSADSSSSDRALVASSAGVVASVSLKDGAMRWRRIGSEHGMKVLRAGNKGVVTAAGDGLVQHWKIGSGELTWQREYPGAVIDVLLVGTTSKQSAVVVRDSELEARSMTGKHEWTLAASTLGSGNLQLWSATSASGDDSTLCALAADASGAKAQSIQVSIETGKVSKSSDVAEKLPASGSIISSHLVSLTNGRLAAQPICGGKGTSFDLKTVKSPSNADFWLMPWQRTAGVFAVTNGATTVIFGLADKGLKNLRTFEGQAVVGPIFSAHADEGGQPVAVAMVTQEYTSIQLLDPASGNVQPATQIPGYTAADHGPAQLFFLQELKSGEHRAVLSAADHSIVGIKGGKVLWLREEALASIRHSFIYGRPQVVSKADVAGNPMMDVLGSLAGFAAALPAMLPALVGNIADLERIKKSFMGGRVDRKRSNSLTMMPNTLLPSSSDELKRFGADKLIIAATKASKVYAMHATTSEIVWTRYFGKGTSCEVGGDKRVGGCDIWMRLLAPSAVHQSEILVVVPHSEDPSKPQHQFVWMDPLTGKILHEESSPPGVAVLSVMELPRKTGLQRKDNAVYPVLVIGKDNRVYPMPASTPEPQELLNENGERLFHYEVDTQNSVVQGFVVGGHAKKGDEMMSLWNFELGSVGETILTSTAPAHREWGHVPVHIKGDASILYKYINSNMLALASVDTLAKGNVSSLNLYALDAVTGRVLHQSRIVGGAAPVRMIACDNWLVAHYWNAKRTRFEITVVELFQSKIDDGPWDILFGMPSNKSKSAHYLEAPVPLQQTYIAPAGCTAMGVTSTQYGITPRSIMFALTTDHIYRVSKDILNPRRPHAGPSGVVKDDSIPHQFQPTKDEPLFPYQPVMPLKPTDVLTHFNSMARVSGIVSSPTALESTSIVFSYGLDLFFIPVQTAKAYDVLSPGFNYTLLYASCGAVFIAFVVTSYIASYRSLKDRWK